MILFRAYRRAQLRPGRVCRIKGQWGMVLHPLRGNYRVARIRLDGGQMVDARRVRDVEVLVNEKTERRTLWPVKS